MIEIAFNITKEEAEAVHQQRLVAGAVDISESALVVGLLHTIAEKNTAIDALDFENAAIWKDNQKNILIALAGLGLAQPDKY